MEDDSLSLPSFKNPPVTEVVLGFQFSSLEGFGTPHYGEYRKRVIDAYPYFDEKAPLPQSSESFDGLKPSPELAMFDAPPLRRCWFQDESKNCMIQLDPGHFYYNWRNANTQEPYPRYPAVRAEFQRLWSDFLEFLNDIGINPPQINLWEVTYVNHLDKDAEWSSFSDLQDVIKITPKIEMGKFLPGPEGINSTTVYAFPEKKGRLHVTLQNAFKQADMKECILLRLVAKGMVNLEESHDTISDLDMGREWIVRAFAEITGEKGHKFWEKD